MKIYLNWLWIVAIAVVGYAIYKHWRDASISPPTGNAFSTVNTNLEQVPE